MSNSPPLKDADHEQSAQSGEEHDHQMEHEQEGAHGQALGDFEVKEQDRWLPIANGWFSSFLSRPSSLRTWNHWYTVLVRVTQPHCLV